MHYQDINEILAKAVKKENMSADYAQEIANANEYLLKRSGTKPDWMDEFLESNRCKLVETICRAISVQRGISSIQGYREGYFNEIVQNANDLHVGDTIDICTEKVDTIYKVKCYYKDRGFELSNIYAFLNREMSDKVGDNSQTGKFGVGIKSFFKFVDSLKIDSNVLFDFRISRDMDNNTVSGRTEINPTWNGEATCIEIEYRDTKINEFNTRKLTTLIEFLDGNMQYDYRKFFITGQDNEMIFDIRSLIFMRLKSKSNKNISKLSFKGSCHKITIWCEEIGKEESINNKEGRWRIGIIKLFLSVDGKTEYEKSYIHFINADFSAAFPLGDGTAIRNRMYSTYYLKEDIQERLLPSGSLFHTPYANLHRNDVGDSEEAIDQVYEKVRNYMKNLYEVMCSEEAAGLKAAVPISDVFHNFIALYCMADRNKYKESPLNLPYCSNAFLPKVEGKSVKSYVVVHRDKEEYDNATYREGNIVRELRENYFEFVEKNKVHDLKEMLLDKQCVTGVKRAYTLIFFQGLEIPKDNYRIAAGILNYFSSVAEYIFYDVTKRRDETIGVSDSEIDLWLIDFKTKLGDYFNANIFLKLIGRYKLNPAIAYDGSIIQNKLSFKDYLFNGTLVQGDGILSKLQNRQYDEMYAALKEGLLKERYIDPGNEKNKFMIRCIRPTGYSLLGWNGTYHYMEFQGPKDSEEQIRDLDLLVERMALDSSFSDLYYADGTLKLFEKCARGMWRRNREDGFDYYATDEQQIIKLSCLKKIRLNKFTRFVRAIKYRAMLKEELRSYINISCVEEKISTVDIINDILPVIVEVPDKDNKKYIIDEYQPDNVQILQIEENSNNEIQKEYADFIFKITGFKVHVYRFLSKTKRRMIAYFGNGTCAVRTGASNNFKKVGKYLAEDNDVFIFYDNFEGNLQDVVIEVLEEYNLSAKRLELMEGYISNGSHTKTMNYMSRRRNLAKVRRKLLLDWADIHLDDLGEISDNEILYRLLTARGSYDIFCPICSDIPLEAFDYGEDTKKKHSRRIVLMENSNPDTNKEIPYIITVACNYCCERLRSTLSKAEFDGKNLIFTTQIAHGTYEKMKNKQQIELSPVNIELMKKFRL